MKWNGVEWNIMKWSVMEWNKSFILLFGYFIMKWNTVVISSFRKWTEWNKL